MNFSNPTGGVFQNWYSLINFDDSFNYYNPHFGISLNIFNYYEYFCNYNEFKDL